MARRLDRIFGSRPIEGRSSPAAMSWGDYLQQVMSYNGHQYGLAGTAAENIGSSFTAHVGQVARTHGVVPAAVAARALPLSQVRFVARNEDRQSPEFGQLTNAAHREALDRPAQLSRAALLSLAEAHHSYGGTAYFTRRGSGLRLLRPDLVDVVLVGSDDQAAVQGGEGSVAGYLYWPNGRNNDPDTYTVDEVSPWFTEPDPECWWRGLSWVGAIVRDVALDNQLNRHVQAFLANAATPNVIIKPDARLTVDQVKEFKKVYDRENVGTSAAGRTLWLGGGSDIEVVGSKIGELAIRDLQGGGETRIAVRSRVPAPLLSIREGMQGSALNASSYGQTRRLFADTHFVPSAEMLCAAVGRLYPQRPDHELTFDPDRILLLQEDRKDAAEIMAAKAAATRQYVDAGFSPASAEKAVRTGNTAVLEHTGLVSVQLLPPGTTGDQPTQGEGA